MRTITTTKNVYKFDELNDEQKQKAIENLYDINIDHEWWDCTTGEDGVGIKLKSFDLDRASNCTLEFIDSPAEIANQIIKNHGESCDTYKTAANFLKERDALVSKFSDGVKLDTVTEENEYEFDGECDDLESEFKKDLENDYLHILRREYEYLTSEEAIIETIEANDYEFDEKGKLV